MNKGKMVNLSSIVDEIIEISLNRQNPLLFLAEDRKGEYMFWGLQRAELQPH